MDRMILSAGAGSFEYSYDNLQAQRNSAKEACLHSLSGLGAVIAGTFGPEDIAETDEMSRSFSLGNFRGEILDDGEELHCYLRLELNPDHAKSLDLFTELLKNQGFDEIEYDFAAPMPLAKLYRTVSSIPLKIVNFDPRRRLVATGSYPLQLGLTVESTPTDSRILLKIRHGHPTDESVKLANPIEIKKMVTTAFQ